MVETTPALEASLLSGEIDMIAGEVGFTLDAALAFETRKRPEWVVIYKPALAFEQLSPNFDNPVLADRRVRQALLYGLNREALIKQVYQGKQIVADTDVNPLDWCYDPNVKKYPYDPAKAAALLAEAGWKKGPDGNLVNAAGKPLTLEIMTTAGNRNREVTELVVQADWKRLGITVTLRNQPAKTLFGEAVLKHAYPDFALFAWFSSPENVPTQTLRSDEVPTAANGFSGENSGGYRNPEMDKLIDAIEVELDRSKRGALWKQLQALFAEDLPMLPITYRSDPYRTAGVAQGRRAHRPPGADHLVDRELERGGVEAATRRRGLDPDQGGHDPPVVACRLSTSVCDLPWGLRCPQV